MVIRTKKIISGGLMEVEHYPIFSDGRRIPTRAPKTKPSSRALAKCNRMNAIKKFIRLVNANFNSSDYLLHPTYEPGRSPQDEEQARKDITNFLRRVRYRREKELTICKAELQELSAMPFGKFTDIRIEKLKAQIKKLSEPLKYIYVIEEQVYKTGSRKGLSNFHFHLFLNGGLDSSVIEEMWKGGLRTNCNRYRPEHFGPEAAARYMSKDPKGSKSFCYSKNLKQPEVKQQRDGAVTKRYVERLAKEKYEDREFWERKYKGYRFIRCVKRWNEYNCNWYVTAIMYKADAVPVVSDSWNDWLDDVC